MPKNTVFPVSLIMALLMLAVGWSNLVIVGNANPYLHNWVEKGEVPPPAGTLPPIVTIYSPDNDTSYPSHSLALYLDVNSTHGYLNEIYYRASWKPGNFLLPVNESAKFLYIRIDIADIPRGVNWIEVYAIGEGSVYVRSEKISSSVMNDYYSSYKITGSSKVTFIIDTKSPAVSIISVENKTYSTSEVQLNFTVDEAVAKTSFSIDGQEVVSGNTTLTGLSNGDHSLTVYATDKAGNTGASQTVNFRTEVPFPTIQVAFAATAIVGVGASLLFYFKRRPK